MKTKALIYKFFIFILLMSIFVFCNKDETTEEPDDPNTGTVQDQDGNNYKTVRIGNQWWMAENLNTTKFRNGDPIPLVAVSYEWVTDTNAAYCNLKNDSLVEAVYGKLYNWYAVADPRKICPQGWHSPNDDDWFSLVEFLGGNQVAGGKLKLTGDAYWNNPNNSATNESNFSAIGGGVRNANTGSFEGFGTTGGWWSISQLNYNRGSVWGLTSLNGAVANYSLDKNSGLSVRCIKDK